MPAMRPLLLRLLILALPASALAASTNVADLPAGHFVLDHKHASIVARVLHMGVSNYTLRFDTFDADFTYDPAHPEATKVEASVDTTSLDVGADYSRHFADQFLDATKFPKATFVSTLVTPGPDGRTGTMTGDLTLRGVTRPVTFQVSFVGEGHGLPFGTIAGFSATGVIKRSDFGSKGLLAYVGDDVSLQIEGEFDRK
jgi:polyisoprenoid-binding protein YceI